MAIIHSGSRSDIIFLFFVLILYFIITLKGIDRKKEFLKNAGIVIFALGLLIIFLSVRNSYYRYYYEGTAKSVLNIFGFEFNLNETAPSEMVEFGENVRAVKSRTFQFSGIQYAMSQNPIFGLGAGALSSDKVLYYSYDAWRVSHTYDMGIVEILISEGILGLIAYISLFTSLIIITVKLYKSEKGFYTDKFLIYLIPIAYLICTLSTANMPHFLFTFIAFLFSYHLTRSTDQNRI